MKADNARPKLEDEVEPFRVEGREKLFGLGNVSQAKFLKIRCELFPHARRRLGTGSRTRMGKKVEVERAVGRLAQGRDLLANQRQRLPDATDRAQAAGIADGRDERRWCEAAHRRLDHGVGEAEQFEEIGAWPHELPLRCRSRFEPELKLCGDRVQVGGDAAGRASTQRSGVPLKIPRSAASIPSRRPRLAMWHRASGTKIRYGILRDWARCRAVWPQPCCSN